MANPVLLLVVVLAAFAAVVYFFTKPSLKKGSCNSGEFYVDGDCKKESDSCKGTSEDINYVVSTQGKCIESSCKSTAKVLIQGQGCKTVTNTQDCQDINRLYTIQDEQCVPGDCKTGFGIRSGKCERIPSPPPSIRTSSSPSPSTGTTTGSGCSSSKVLYDGACVDNGTQCDPKENGNALTTNYSIDRNYPTKCRAYECKDQQKFYLSAPENRCKIRSIFVHEACSSAPLDLAANEIHFYNGEGECVKENCIDKHGPYFKAVENRCVPDTTMNCEPPSGVTKDVHGVYRPNEITGVCEMQGCTDEYTKQGTSCIYNYKDKDCTDTLDWTSRGNDPLSNYIFNERGECVWHKCKDGYMGPGENQCTPIPSSPSHCTGPLPNVVYQMDQGTCTNTKTCYLGYRYVENVGCVHPTAGSTCDLNPKPANVATAIIDNNGICVPNECQANWGPRGTCNTFTGTGQCNQGIDVKYVGSWRSDGTCQPSGCNEANGWKPVDGDWTKGCEEIKTEVRCDQHKIGELWYRQIGEKTGNPYSDCRRLGCDASAGFFEKDSMCRHMYANDPCNVNLNGSGKYFRRDNSGNCLESVVYCCDAGGADQPTECPAGKYYEKRIDSNGQVSCNDITECVPDGTAISVDTTCRVPSTNLSCITSGSTITKGTMKAIQRYKGATCTEEQRNGIQIDVECPLAPCPPDCILSVKKPKSGGEGECTVSCGSGGTYKWYRTIEAGNVGSSAPCNILGAMEGTDTCNNFPCPDITRDCEMGPWYSESTATWAKCSAVCGPGINREKRDIKQLPTGSGKPCDSQWRIVSCNQGTCTGPPTNCVISDWSEWSPCTSTDSSGITSGIGVKARVKRINNAPTNGGDCSGSLIEYQMCGTSVSIVPPNNFTIVKIPNLIFRIHGARSLCSTDLPITYYYQRDTTPVLFESPDDALRTFLKITQHMTRRNFLVHDFDIYTNKPSLLLFNPYIDCPCSPLLSSHKDPTTEKYHCQVNFFCQNNTEHWPDLARPLYNDFICIRNPANNTWYVLRQACYSLVDRRTNQIYIDTGTIRSIDNGTYVNIVEALKRVHETNQHGFWYDGQTLKVYPFPLVNYNPTSFTYIFVKTDPYRTSEPMTNDGKFFQMYDPAATMNWKERKIMEDIIDGNHAPKESSEISIPASQIGSVDSENVRRTVSILQPS